MNSVTKVTGRLAPDELYTLEGCMEFGGLGEESICEARLSGMVTPIALGRRLYYDGAELIAWIKATGQRRPKRNKSSV